MTYKAKTQEEKKKEVEAAFEKIEKAVPEVFSSKNFKEYLKFMSKFHNYSYNNILLIKAQNPYATLVAGYNAWQTKFERRVVEKGAIKILAPQVCKMIVERPVLDEFGEKKLDENGEEIKEKVEKQYLRYRLVNVFDISQTEGKPIPELTHELSGTTEVARALISSVYQVSDISIKYAGNENENIKSGAKGYYSHKYHHIVIKENMSDTQTAKTMIHEYAHGKLHSDSDKDRTVKEIEAEATAFAVSDYFGLDTGDYSFPYVAGWAMGKTSEELHEVLAGIQKNVNELIQQIEPVFKKELELERLALEEDKDIEMAFELSIEEPEMFNTKNEAINFIKNVHSQPMIR